MFSNSQLQLQQLACQRGDKILFTDLSTTFSSGDLVQIEGHNGIGKTSLLRMLTGLARPLQGEVLWNGVSITQQREAYHQDLLYLGHHAGVKPELTAWENLKFYQQMSCLNDVQQNGKQNEERLWNVLETVGLLGREDLPASQLSAGQQKRIALARLWLSPATLWILDEPFTAIDKKGIEILTALFENHAAQNGIVLLTSHQEVPSAKLTSLLLEQYKYQGL